MLGAIYQWMACPPAPCVLSVLTTKFTPSPCFTSDKCLASQNPYRFRFNGCAIVVPARAASSTQQRVTGFWRCITDRPTGAVIRDATFFFDKRPSAWYLKRRDTCRHVTCRLRLSLPRPRTHRSLCRDRSYPHPRGHREMLLKHGLSGQKNTRNSEMNTRKPIRH